VPSVNTASSIIKRWLAGSSTKIVDKEPPPILTPGKLLPFTVTAFVGE